MHLKQAAARQRRGRGGRRTLESSGTSSTLLGPAAVPALPAGLLGPSRLLSAKRDTSSSLDARRAPAAAARRRGVGAAQGASAAEGLLLVLLLLQIIPMRPNASALLHGRVVARTAGASTGDLLHRPAEAPRLHRLPESCCIAAGQDAPGRRPD